MSDIAIKVDGVSKSFKLPHEKQGSIKNVFVNLFRGKRSYEKQEVLKNVSFEIKKGEFFGIVGKNGSGKSTLLKLMAGIYSPNGGAIEVNGKLTPFIELGVGFNPELTGRENVFLNGALLGFSRHEMAAMYDEIVEFAELERFMDQKLKNYSSGMQVRLAFSIAIQAKGDVLVLDEVLAVGDAAFQQKCYSYFEELKSKNKTVVFVSHDMKSVKRFCTRALLIEDGKIKKIGLTDEISDQYLLDNIAGQKTQKHGPPKSLVEELDLKIKSPKSLSKNDQLKIEIDYMLKKSTPLAIGISLLNEGIAFADINSKSISLSQKPHTLHRVNLNINTYSFNPGLYTINCSILNADNAGLIYSKINCGQFLIRGSDETRAGGLYIDGVWSK